MLALDRLRWFCRAWRYRHRLEPREIELVLQQLSPGDVAVAVGAHKGGYTFWMHRASGCVDEVFDWLTERGYRGAFVGPGGLEDSERFDPARHQADQDAPGYVNNFFFESRPGR